MYIYLWHMHIHTNIYAHNVYIYVHTYNIHSFVHLYSLNLLMHFFVSVANSLDKELAILFSLFAATTSLLSFSRLEIRIPLLPLPCAYNQMSASTRQLAVYLQWFSISQGTNKDCKRCHRFIISGDEERKKKLPVEIKYVLLHFDVPSLIHLKRNCKHLLKLPFIT